VIEDRAGAVENDDIDVGAGEHLLESGTELGVITEPRPIERRRFDEDRDIHIAVGLGISARNRSEQVRLENFGATFEVLP
jgi:hypothetical protein